MQYNTQKEKLLLPEYGRNIQNMVDHCVLIEDPAERKKCAYTVIDIMGNMFPHPVISITADPPCGIVIMANFWSG